MTDTLQTLLERLQNADGPDPSIDRALEDVLLEEKYHQYSFGGGKVDEEIVSTRCPLRYTASLDFSIGLVGKVSPSISKGYASATGFLHACSWERVVGKLPIESLPIVLLIRLVEELIAEQE